MDACDAGYAPARVVIRLIIRHLKKKKREKRKKNGKTQKLSPGDPGDLGVPGGESSISLVIGTPKFKRITLGDPGYPEGIPRVEGIPT